MSAFELPCCLLLALGVLVRYNLRSMPVYDQRGDLVDVMVWLRALRVGKPAELRVQVVSNAHGASRWVQGRLVAERLPDKEAEEARRRVRREHGSAATAEMLETAGYVVLFTTASRGAMPARRCLAAYRLRWQVELLFKRCKSLCGFDRLPNYRDDTIHAWLCAKVLLGLIMDRIGSAAAGVFPLHGGDEKRSAPASATAPSHGSPALEADEHPASRDDRRALALQAERAARRAAEHHAAA